MRCAPSTEGGTLTAALDALGRTSRSSTRGERDRTEVYRAMLQARPWRVPTARSAVGAASRSRSSAAPSATSAVAFTTCGSSTRPCRRVRRMDGWPIIAAGSRSW